MKGTGVLREQNKRKILSKIRQLKRTTRQDLVTEMDVSKNTVSLIVEELITKDIIKEVGIKIPGQKGRPKQMIELNRDGIKAIGIAIEKEDLEYAVINYYGEVIEKETILFSCVNVEETKEKIISILTKLNDKYDRILGAGIAIPGIVNSEKRIVYKSVRLGWENISIYEIADHVKFPVFVQNSVNMSALSAIEEDGYQTNEKDSFYYIHVGDGVGGAYIINKQIMNGASSTAGEIGHISVNPKGQRCVCGQKGCLEQLISLPTFKEKLIHEGFISVSIDNVLNSDGYHQSQVLKDIVYQFGEFLGRSIIQIMHLFNPNQIIIDSPYVNFEEFANGCTSYIKENALKIPYDQTKVTFGKSHYSKSIGAGLCTVINYEENA